MIARQHGQNNGKSEMRGSLHCAAYDETVSTRSTTLRVGRDDVLFRLGGKNRQQQRQSNHNSNDNGNDNDNDKYGDPSLRSRMTT